MTDVDQRPTFYEGQYLSAADLTAAVDYGRVALARSTLAAHHWGIALGLDLVEVPRPGGGTDVFLQPGFAWDGFGRPIRVTTPTVLSGALFAAFDAAFVPGGTPPTPVPVDVWLAYDEVAAQPPRPGFEICDATGAFGRAQEGFRIEVGPRTFPAGQRDPVELDGRLVDAEQALTTFDATAPLVVDADVPHQVLPVPATRQWLVPVGAVRWQPGAPGSFVPADDATKDRTTRTRRYCGAVAGTVEAAGGHVRVHDRSAAYSDQFTAELLWVEGTTRADGDVNLYAARLGLRSSHTEDPVQPFQVARTDDPGRATMRLVIGDQSAGANRLAVGPTAGAGFAEHLVVTDDGKVGVRTSAPLAPLHIPADGVEIGTSAAPGDNFYLQSNTDGPRALRIYNKDVGSGSHVATFTADGMVGIGTTAPSAPLHVQPPLGIRQGALYLSGDSRWSSVSFNAHHDAGNGGWVFPDPTLPVATIEMDAIGGPPRVEVFTSTLGNNQTWVSRLAVDGHTGNVVMGLSGGNLGVGRGAPTARVDVEGDVQVSGNLRVGALMAPVADQALRVLWGVVSETGVKVGGTGYSVSHTGPGRWLLRFDTAFAAQPTLVASRVYGDASIDAGATVEPGQTAVVDRVVADSAIVATANAAGGLEDGAFTFLAIGPR